MALIDNIVFYQKYDENANNTVADSVSGFNGTWQVANGWTTGIINSAGDFSGSNYVSSGSVALGLGTSITISLWVKPTTLTSGSYYCFFSFGGYIGGGFIFQRAGDSGNILRVAWNGTDYYDGPVFTATGSWKHIVIVISAGVPQTFYVNNVSVR